MVGDVPVGKESRCVVNLSFMLHAVVVDVQLCL